MKENMKKVESDNWKRLSPWIPVIALGLISGFLLQRFPESQKNFNATLRAYSMEMLTVFPAVLVLMGFMTVFISKEFISRHLGQESGFRGFVVSLFLGTLPTGPLYMAFPLAAVFRKKGARTANLVIFLSAWACIKLPQELVELRFLGPAFMLTRLTLTVAAVLAMGLIIERFTGSDKRISP